MNQRYRWTRGVLQAALKQFVAWRTKGLRRIEFIAWLVVLLCELVLWSIAELSGVVAIMIILVTQGVSGPFLFIFFLLTLVDVNAAVFAVIAEDDDWTLIPLVVPARFYYGPMLAIGKIFACYDQLRGRKAAWS